MQTLSPDQIAATVSQLGPMVQDIVDQCVQQARTTNLNSWLGQLEGVLDLDAMQAIRAEHVKNVNAGLPGLDSDAELAKRRGPRATYQRRPGFTPEQNNEAFHAARAKAEVLRRRARGERVNTDEVFARHCG